MRSISVLTLVALSTVACEPELQIRDEPVVIGEPNAPELEVPTRTDVITQVTTPKVDVLWVIDDSCSMADEQQKLAENFPLFIEFFLDSGLDWHIGVLSTDMTANSKSGKLQGAAGFKYLDNDVPNPAGLFADMAQLGTGGSFEEKGRAAAYAALTDPLLSGYNAGFYRDEASLHLVAISDEEDQSGNNPTRNEFIGFLRSLKQEDDMVTFSSIVGPNPAACGAQTGSNYHAVTNAIGGIIESICEDDWAPVLEELGLQAAGLRREYFLSELPVADSIRVYVEDGDYVYGGVNRIQLEDSDLPTACSETWQNATFCFTYDYDDRRNSIIMEEFVPSPLAQVNITYDLLSGAQGVLDVE